MRGPHPQSHVTLRYCGHVTNKKQYISTFTRPMYPKLDNVVTQVRGPYPPQSHVALRYRGHVINKIRYISTFTRPMYLKLKSVVTLNEGAPPTKSRETSTTWSRENSNTLYLHLHKSYGFQTQQDIGYSVVITIEVCAERNHG